MAKLSVGILGATGIVGQQFVSLLQGHPWFEIGCLVASERSAGRTYREAIANRSFSSAFYPEFELPVLALQENTLDEIAAYPLLFSALQTKEAALFEESLARRGALVISAASYHRKGADVPLIIPEINADHLDLLKRQRERLKITRGGIITKPNCTLQGYTLPLGALDKRFPLRAAIVTSLQAASGAGYPGVSSLDLIDNTVCYIPGEEEKSEQEPLKILGELREGQLAQRENLAFSLHCNRVPVSDGHTTCVSFAFQKEVPTLQTILELWQELPRLQLPSAPERSILLHSEENRPQPRLDRLSGNGMSISIGRVRPCSVLDYRFVSLSHNTIRGAAGGCILTAELAYKRGYLQL